MNWASLKQDFRERFMNYETAKGVYFVAYGLAVLISTWLFTQHLLWVFGTAGGWLLFSEGLRKIMVNRIKQAAVREQMLAERLVKNANQNSDF